jgi:fatty-acyl-CoA synthase
MRPGDSRVGGPTATPHGARTRRKTVMTTAVLDRGVDAPDRCLCYLDRILARAADEPDSVLVRDRDRSWTAARFGGLVTALADRFAALGLGRGDVVALAAPVTPEALAARYAAGLLGCATVCCPYGEGAPKLAGFLAAVRADVLVGFPGTDALVESMVARGLVPAAIVLDRVDPDDVAPAVPPASQGRADDLAVLVSSGGTTGVSKASRRTVAGWTRTVDAAADPDRRQLICTPLAYIAQVQIDQTLLGGGTVVLREGFEPAEVLRTIEADRITHLCLVEPLLVDLADHPDLPARDLSSLVAISHIGADAAPSLRRRLLERVGPVLAHPYGASEAGIISILAGPDYDLGRPELLGTAGRVLPGVTVRLQRRDGSPAPVGEAGLVLVRSGGVAEGYRGGPEISPFRGGWYRTGDLAVLDADGYLQVRGRARDALHTLDGPVLPVDVQDVLCERPDVRYAVAVPLGFRFGVVVLPAAGATATAAELRAYASGRLDADVVGPVVLADRIPVTDQGKPDRAALRALLGA